MPALSPDLVGLKGEPSKYSYDEKDALLYNVGIGARPYDDVDFLYEGNGPKVFPTFAVIGGMAGMGVMGQLEGINPVMILHGEQSITLHRELPPKASLTLQGELVGLWDKGAAAVVEIETTASDDQGPLFTAKAGIFARGSGGFGGERGPSAKEKNNPPEKEPDHVVSDETRMEQAAIYRLSGDRNPLHADPKAAAAGGFKTPILHGLCTYGVAGRAIIKACCGGDPARLRSLQVRFSSPVFPGETIRTEIWREGERVSFRARVVERDVVVLNNGLATVA